MLSVVKVKIYQTILECLDPLFIIDLVLVFPLYKILREKCRCKTFSWHSVWNSLKTIHIPIFELISFFKKVKNVLFSVWRETVGFLDILYSSKTDTTPKFFAGFLHISLKMLFKTRLFIVFILKLNGTSFKTKRLLWSII